MEKLVFAAATFPDTDSSIHQLPEYNHVAAAAEADRITDGVTETTSEKEEGEEDVDQGELQQQQNDDEARDFSIDDVKKMINAER